MTIQVGNEVLVEIVGVVLKIADSDLTSLQETTDLRSYNLGSITFVELIVAIEERFDIAIPDEELEIDHVNTIHKLKQLIEKYKVQSR